MAVINLGTNDLLAGSGTDADALLPDEAGFKAAYRAFLQRSRTLQDPATDGVAGDWHPSAATHPKMAESLTRFIRDAVRP